MHNNSAIGEEHPEASTVRSLLEGESWSQVL